MWYRSLFVYCHHLHEGLKHIQEDVGHRDIRKLVENSEVVQLSKNQTYDVILGAFVFAGQIEQERQTYVKGNFIVGEGTVKSLEKGSFMLNFVPRRREISHMEEHFED